MENKTKMKFWSIVLLTINSIIGTGIFLTPGSVANSSGALAPLIYIAAAIFACVLAVTFASASKYVNKNGAAYAYSKAAFGENVGLYVGITRFVAASIAWGVMATAVVKTTCKIFSIGLDKDGNISFATITIGFLLLIIILLIINLIGTKVLTIISNISTLGKMLALIITIVVGILLLLITHKNNFNLIYEVKQNLELDSIGLVTSIIAAFYAFTGFESVASGASDMENPEKNLPKAIPLAIGIIALIYFGIVFVAMCINPVALVESKEVVVLAAIFDNSIISNIIIYGALVSMFGINVAASFHTPRIAEAMAREKQIPQIFNKRTSNDVPLNSFILTAIFAIIIPMAFTYDMKGIMIISSISRFVQFLVVPICVILFYYGKNKEKILDAKKNFITDVVFSIISLILTILLLRFFDWKKQFSTTINGELSPNWYAIIAMLIGYIIFPAILFITKKKNK